jgi:hypothetical protein
VAKVNLELFFKFQGSGPRVNIEEVQGPFCKVARIIWFLNYFLIANVVDSIHGSVDRGGSSSELGLAATPEHRSLPAGVQQREGTQGSWLGPHRGSGSGGEAVRWRR